MKFNSSACFPDIHHSASYKTMLMQQNLLGLLQ